MSTTRTCILQFSIHWDVRNVHFDRGARRALRLFGGWVTLEFAELLYKTRDGLLSDVKRCLPMGVLMPFAGHAG